MATTTTMTEQLKNLMPTLQADLKIRMEEAGDLTQVYLMKARLGADTTVTESELELALVMAREALKRCHQARLTISGEACDCDKCIGVPVGSGVVA